MKLFYILLFTLPLLSHSYPTVEKTISLEDVVELDSEHAETGGDSQIAKRSGSFDYVAHLKSGLLSSIGHASASIASGSSGTSSSSGGYKTYDTGHHGNSVEYNPWSFKKSVLNTIFQAVKAITGGVTALKGQLIKGSGYALSASGNLVAASGDKVTDVGKAIINSAQLNAHTYATGGDVHPFAKFSSLSGASSGGSSGVKHSAGPVVHTETITTYEIPGGHGGHSSYGPPSKPPTYSTATHQYLPPGGAGYTGGGAPFSGGHVAFEAPQSNYLHTGYGHDGHDDFNIYGRHKKLNEAETRKAAAQLQEILSLLPDGKTEFTASKTVVLDTAHAHTGSGSGSGSGEINPENVELQTYGLPNDLGPLEALSHTESITAAYGRRPQQLQENPSDIYRQMAKKQTPEEIYIQKHPNEGYDYRPTRKPDNGAYKYNNYHAANSALKDLTPIIAALEVAKRRAPTQPGVSTQYAIEKSVYKVQPPPPPHASSHPQRANAPQHYNYAQPPPPPPAVQKTKHIYFNPAQSKADNSRQPNSYSGAYKVRRHAASGPVTEPTSNQLPKAPYFKAQDYEIEDPLLFNRMLMSF